MYSIIILVHMYCNYMMYRHTVHGLQTVNTLISEKAAVQVKGYDIAIVTELCVKIKGFIIIIPYLTLMTQTIGCSIRLHYF